MKHSITFLLFALLCHFSCGQAPKSVSQKKYPYYTDAAYDRNGRPDLDYLLNSTIEIQDMGRILEENVPLWSTDPDMKARVSNI